MEVFDTVQTVRHLAHGREELDRKPVFEVGDYVEKISSGLNCTIDGVRFNYDHNSFEYHDGGICSDGWLLERTIQKA